jgi:hypothetical protein
MRTILFAAMISLLSANCGSDDTEEETASSTTETNTQTPVLSTPDNTVTVPNSITGSSNNPSAPVTNTKSTTTGVKSGAGLNPAHGQPGHRCDLAVGAPLDSKPVTTTQNVSAEELKRINANPSNITVNGQPPSTPVVNQPSSLTTVGAGMNPAHGQPGHRCDIPVGAPLNSKPTTTPQVIPATTPPKQ